MAQETASSLFAKFYEVESSLVYHTIDEIEEYWSFIKGRRLSQFEVDGIKSRVVFERDHLWLKDTARVGLYV